MKLAIEPQRFNVQTRGLLQFCVELTDRYVREGLVCSVRHAFYKAAVAGVIQKSDADYQKVSTVMTNGRWAGLIDWDVVVDESREPSTWASWESAEACATEALDQFRLDRWQGQACYVEIWVEKVAVKANLEDIAAEHHVTLQPGRGNCSTSGVYRAARRFNRHHSAGRRPIILYLGDHDPLGLHFPGEVTERIGRFGLHPEVRRLAVNFDQVETFGILSHPVKAKGKTAEKRIFAEYLAKYGNEAWELDAFEPRDLQDLVRAELAKLIDAERLAEVVAEEDDQAGRVRALLDAGGEA
jgi:hypothetical protein